MLRLSPTRVILCLALLLFILLCFSLSVGVVSLDFQEVMSVLSFQNSGAQSQAIIWSLRLPRVLLAAVVGALLASSGTMMQGLFRNPLADPSLIGVTAGASLGASLALVFLSSFSLAWLSLPATSLGAFAGGALTVFLVYRLSQTGQGTSVVTMLLAGIGITALAASFSSALDFYANDEQLRRLSLWRMGGVDDATMPGVWMGLAMVVCFAFAMPRFTRALNALLLGESEAKHLGVNVESVKKRIVLLVAAGVGVSVALAGTIAFVGLVVPHILRLLIGPNHRYLLPASALAGALLLVLADILARSIMPPLELPIGLVTSFIGAPLFISLLTRRYLMGLS